MEDAPLITDKEKPTNNDSRQLEWTGSSRISIKTAQDFHIATSPIQSAWKQNLQYSVTIQRAWGVWETVEDHSDEQLVLEPLFEDIMTGRPVLLESCLRFGGDPNLRNDSGETLLTTAASAGNEYAVAELLGRDADPNLKNRNGCTASYLARLQKHRVMAELLDSARGVCVGPIKAVCDRFPVPPVTGGTITADPLLIPPDPRLAEKPKPTKPDNSTKVIFLDRPQPEYTEEARRNQITGTVVLRVVFLASGEVGRIRVIAGLPYGLTERAVAAAKKIKFKPATLDGHPVDKERHVEYNFGPP
jgi:TonB family protein